MVLKDKKDDAYIAKVERMTLHMHKHSDTLVVVWCWINQLDDSKWNELLKKDAICLRDDMQMFDDFAAQANWGVEHMDALLRNIDEEMTKKKKRTCYEAQEVHAAVALRREGG